MFEESSLFTLRPSNGSISKSYPPNSLKRGEGTSQR